MNLPQHICGMRDEGAEQFFVDAGKCTWIVFSFVATDGPRDFTANCRPVVLCDRAETFHVMGQRPSADRRAFAL